MSKILPQIDKTKIFSTDNGGLALTTEMEKWFEDVTDTLNFVVAQIAEQDRRKVDRLAEIILAINHSNFPSKGCKECRAGATSYEHRSYRPQRKRLCTSKRTTEF